jgi:AcrR family transcriptional regulator
MANASSKPNPSGPSERQERRRARNRAALLNATREAVQKKGVEATTMQDITTLADVAAGTIYNYFDSKQELLRAVFEDELSNLALSVQVIADEMHDTIRSTACGYWLTLEGVATKPLWRHLMRRPEIMAGSPSSTPGTISRGHIAEIRTRYIGTAHSAQDVETTWWQCLGTLFSLANAVQDGHLTCNEDFLRSATSNMLRMAGVPDEEIKRAVAEPPRPIAYTQKVD